MDNNLVESFISITGLDFNSANYYLEMSGYDLETALQFFFEGGGAGVGVGAGGGGNESGTGGGNNFQENNTNNTNINTNNNNNVMRYLFSDINPPESWLKQGLQFDYYPTINSGSIKWSGIGIKQHKNGPCGVLIAFQATVIANLIEQGRLNEDIRIHDDDVIQGIVDILLLCKGEKDQISICTWSDPINGVGKSLEIIELPTHEGTGTISVVLESLLQQFYSPGGNNNIL